ncbi:transglycosylase SLT domain-containing protein [Psychrobacillus sp. OK032]|uniref:transglycosylase SLT domain-containing protein n=1 Tax=Psychrobacillus sp. OK032 TaxID=1884358 RepID=UPI0008C92FE2|nr:transglycosylase SLT domain-containing protein [Psychrobacillus sp. OK032]SES31384.1 Transglycosylase SLT domain-containing protein [Psychrobacillus sp. OK032]
MKSIKMIAGFLTCLLLLGWSYEEASAESTWASKCSSFGDINPNLNPTFQHMNCLLTTAALEAKVPPEVVKAVASRENGAWKQFDENGQPIISKDNGIGLMQITNQPSYDQERLKYDVNYNIQAGVEILSKMYDRKDLPKIKGAGPEVIENWYFPVMAYNGIKPVNSPLYQSNGFKNIEAYQEKVFSLIEKDSYLNGTTLGQFPFNTADFEYNPNSSENIVFKNMEYTLTDQLHTSAYQFKKGDKVLVTGDAVSLRSQPGASSVKKSLSKNTTLIIEGNFFYDRSLASVNQFVWYPVKTEDQKLSGYISSAYITKKLDVSTVPTVPAVKVMWGKTELKLGQIGKVTILSNTNLVKMESNGSLTTVRPLKKGDEYRVYSYKSNHGGLYGVGNGSYVQKSAKVKYETPSKRKLALLSQ